MKNLNLQKFAAWYVTKGCVKILWDDNNNELGLRPDSLDVTYSFYDGDTKESTHTITVKETDTIEPELDFNGSRMYPQNWYFQESNSWAKIDGYLDGGTYYTITVDSYPQEIEGYELNEYDYGISNVDFMDGDAIRYCCITIVYKLKKSQEANRKRVHFNNETQPQIYFGHNPIKKIIYDGKTVWIDENLARISYEDLSIYSNSALIASTHAQIAEGNIQPVITYEALEAYSLGTLNNYTYAEISTGTNIEQREFITFYLNDGTTTTEFYCEEGMTWQEYCASVYNTEGIYCYDPTPGNVTDYIIWPSHGYYTESCANIITDGTTYNRQTGTPEK